MSLCCSALRFSVCYVKRGYCGALAVECRLYGGYLVALSNVLGFGLLTPSSSIRCSLSVHNEYEGPLRPLRTARRGKPPLWNDSFLCYI